ncbi:MAG: DNA topoisomerase (ATP-hydrolyzing) subunit B [Planctomycetota bacterium]
MTPPADKNPPAKYDASSIQVLEGLEAVRKRPAMYIGDTTSAGLHHLIWEVVDNSVDEALQGRCSLIVVKLHADGSVSVLDDGAGIPTDIHPKMGVPALEVILTKLHAGGKFDKGSYQVSGGLHGVGVSVVNALSEWLDVEVYRDGKIYHQTFEKGVKTSEMAVLGDTDRRGTLVHYKADPEIFDDTEVVWGIVHKRMRELSYLMGTSNLRIDVEDERTGQKDTLFHPEGLVEFVKELGHGKNALHDQVVYVQREHVDEESDSRYEVECALQYNDGYNEQIFTFVNNINTHEGGTHLSGFKTALTRTLNQFARTNKLVKDKEKYPSGDDLREGLVAVLSVKVPEPQFESQTKIRLGNREVEGIVNTVVGDGLRDWFDAHPKEARKIFDKAMDAARAREAARKAREQVRRKSALESSSLPVKLADCHKGTPREKAEIFLVEGDSAGGSAITGRGSYQAVLPLRGKILNVEKASNHKILGHREIEAIWSAIGTGFLGEEFDESRLRYSKIIIMTDADVDGSHIRTLLLTFFYRKMPELVDRGYIYVAQPPLYLIKKGKTEIYCHTEKERRDHEFRIGVGQTALVIDGVEQSEGVLAETIETLRALVDFSGTTPAKDGFTISDLLRQRREHGSWPTHLLLLRGDRVPRAVIPGNRDATVLFVHGGEAELERVVQAMKAEVPGLGVAFQGDKDAQADLVIRTLHLSARFKEVVQRAEDRGLPFDLLDAPFDQEALDTDPELARIRLRTAKETRPIGNLVQALDAIAAMSGKDVEVKRFKGLGEMNADQLWETTMDPATRRLYRVGYADEVDTDKLFTILMGSEVEPRREFIERHALEITNLDV